MKYKMPQLKPKMIQMGQETSINRTAKINAIKLLRQLKFSKAINSIGQRCVLSKKHLTDK